MSTTLYRASSWPGIWAVLNVAAAAALVIGGVVSGSRDVAIWAVLPAAWAVVALLRHPWGFWVEIGDDGVTWSGGTRASFSDLQVVLARPAVGVRTGPFPIHAVFRDHVLRIPARLDAPSKEVYDALSAHAPRHPSSAIADVVREFRDEQAATFGDDRVWHCGGRSRLGWIRRGRASMSVGLGLLLAGSLVLPLGIVQKREDIVGFGCMGVFFGLSLMIASSAGQNPPKVRKSWEGNGIVVAPLGLAVSQADLVGQLGWDEIRQVIYPVHRRTFRLTGAANEGDSVLEIRVAGAVVRLLDVYDRSLDVIHQRIMANWKHDSQECPAPGGNPGNRQSGQYVR